MQENIIREQYRHRNDVFLLIIGKVRVRFEMTSKTFRSASRKLFRLFLFLRRWTVFHSNYNFSFFRSHWPEFGDDKPKPNSAAVVVVDRRDCRRRNRRRRRNHRRPDCQMEPFLSDNYSRGHHEENLS